MAQANRLICITGPTASGKSALAVALAQQLNTEIISSDSMQIYRGMDIGTAKPTKEERGGVQHHLIDILDPEEQFSVARFVARADACAQKILAKGKTPIVVGGTGLYMDALIECGTFMGDENNAKMRQDFNRLAEDHGVQYVHDLLRQVDSESAERLHPNNLKRVIRALEVYHQTGMTIGDFNAKNKRALPKYDAIMIGICPNSREVLYARINARVDQMVANGLLEEARTLYHAGKLVGTAGQAIGYKELVDFFNNHDTIENCIERLKQRTRNYAKRQLTWLKKDQRIHWITYDEEAQLSELLHASTKYLAAHGV